MTGYLNARVIVTVGDITEVVADALVNAANASLMGGGGVDGAIHRAGGPSIRAACEDLRTSRYPGGLPTGQAVATTAGALSANHVIHTVGPVWHDGTRNEAKLLADCYANSLRVAKEHGCRTVAFPAISTGVYGFPKAQAARIASRAVTAFLAEDESIGTVTFVFFSAGDADIFTRNHRFSTD